VATTFMVRGRTVATAATAGLAVATLWNPHASARLQIHEIWICANVAPGAGSAIEIRRTTTRGTPGSTVTPTSANDVEGAIAPVSGAVLDINVFSVVPTITANALAAWTLGAVAGAGLIMPFARGIEVPAGGGLALVTANAVIVPISDVTYVWTD
jgi:hypothetical protein